MRWMLLLILAASAFSVEYDISLGTGPVPASASGAPPTGAAGGDLGGTYPNPTVAAARFSAPGAIGSVTPSTGAFTSVTDSGLTSGRVTTASTAGLLADDAGMTYDSAADLLTVNHNGSALPAIPAADDTVLQIGGKDANTVRLIIDGFAGTPTFQGRRANTTNASKSGVVNNDVLCQVAAIGYTSAGAYSTGARASIHLDAAETWDGTNQATKIVFNCTPTGGSTTQANKLTITGQSATFASGVPVTASDTTDASSGTAAAINTLGGVGATKAVWAGTNITAANGVFSDTVDDAITNTTTTMATFAHTSTGTVANSFGTQVLFNLEDDGGTSRNAAAINTQWTIAATATRTSSIAFQTVSSGAALATSMTIAPTVITVPQAVQLQLNSFSAFTITQTAASGGVRACMVVTPAANTTVTSGTEDPQVTFNFARTQTWSTTVPATQREFKIAAPTYDCTAGSQTITEAATVDIIGPPVATANVAITYPCALRIEAGHLEMVGTSGNSLRITTATANGSVATVMSNVGPSGAQTAIQGWLLINVAGTNRYIPFWAAMTHSPREAVYRDAWLNGHRISMTMREYEDECCYCLDAQ